jgi:hypothetical protein
MAFTTCGLDTNPSVGRFISEDPLGFGGGDVNLFTYVKNNPINRIDPRGTNTIAIGGTIGGLVGGPPGAVIGAATGAVVGVIIAGVIVRNWTTNPPVSKDKKDAEEDCHEECAHHLGKDDCSQGFPYTNCMKECMARKGFRFP